MNLHVTVEAIAGEDIAHGVPVRVDGGRAYYEPDPTKMDGVTKRPHQAGAETHHRAGTRLRILTDGSQLSAMPDGTRRTDLRDGKVIP